MYAPLRETCVFGMTMQDEDGALNLVRKRTEFITNAPEIAKALNRMCTQDHPHTRLEG